MDDGIATNSYVSVWRAILRRWQEKPFTTRAGGQWAILECPKRILPGEAFTQARQSDSVAATSGLRSAGRGLPWARDIAMHVTARLEDLPRFGDGILTG